MKSIHIIYRISLKRGWFPNWPLYTEGKESLKKEADFQMGRWQV